MMMLRTANLKKWRPIENLSHQFIQRCSVSGTAKGKGKDGQVLKRSKVTIRKKGLADPSAKGGGGGPRRKEMDDVITDCLNATSLVRYLKPKEREREAERERMGLISETRKKEIENLKAARKEKKAEAAAVGGTEGLDLIKLGLVEDVDMIPKFELTVEDGRMLAKEYSRVKMMKHRARQKAESEFLNCKKAAIEALPYHLRDAALVPDLTPFPVNRFMATLTPPIEGYREKMNEAAKKNSIKAKLR